MKTGTREKWEFAIGTTSRVPGRPNHHYLIMDIDQGFVPLQILRMLGAKHIYVQPTPGGGWHVYTNLIYNWKELFSQMPSCVDEAWLRIGKRRGYLFLADKAAVCLGWEVERMVIHYNGKKEGDARRTGFHLRA